MTRKVRGWLAVLAVLLMAALAGALLPASPAGAAPVLGPGAISMTIRSVTPNSPAPAATAHQLTVELDIINNIGVQIPNVTIEAVRGVPITRQTELSAAIAHPQVPTFSTFTVAMRSQQIGALDPCTNCTATVVYTTTYGTQNDADLCQCANAIYPLYFSAVTVVDGRKVTLASAQTFLPSFLKTPAKAQIGWVWPLLDTPHRGVADSLFADDSLAAEIAPGGRLDQLLDVVEQVGRNVPLTILTDPNLIDELAVMATGYRVKSDNVLVRHPASVDAANWLDRLRQVLALPKMEISFTPYADPPVQSLQQAGLHWAMGLPTERAKLRVAQALGTQALPNDVQWPAGGTIGPDTLSTLVDQGVTSVVLSDKTLPKGTDDPVVPTALAPVRSSAGTATAAVTSTPIEHQVKALLNPNGPGLTGLPRLVATLALRVVTDVTAAPYLVITPPRNMLTVDPTVAARVIEATADTAWSRAVPVGQAVSTLPAVDHGRLHVQSFPQIGPHALTHLRYVIGAIPGIASMFKFKGSSTSERIHTALSVGVARAESTALLNQSGTNQAAKRLAHRVRLMCHRVVLVHPTTSAAYTLGSQNSRLPVTITNRLPDRVHVVVTMQGAQGFSATPQSRSIPANSTVQLRVPTHVNRVGLFYVQVQLTAPNGLPLSTPLRLTVHSTALGTIGVIITVVAAVVLVAALLARFVRRQRRRRADEGPTPPAPPIPVTASAGSDD